MIGTGNGMGRQRGMGILVRQKVLSQPVAQHWLNIRDRHIVSAACTVRSPSAATTIVTIVGYRLQLQLQTQ